MGIRIALESFSPLLLMCLRYTISGAALLVGARMKGAQFPSREQAWKTAAYGIGIIGFGTGSLAFAEQWIPSGLAALIVSVQPFWMTGVEAILGDGDPLRRGALGGMLVGLLGVIFLIAPTLSGGTGMKPEDLLKGFLLLQFGAAMWSVGSSFQRRLTTRAHPFVNGGVQQLATGLAFLIPALFTVKHAVWDFKGIAAVVYLAVFGGIVGYSAYIFTLDRLPVALVSIYTYINPLVAVVLGYLFYREPFGWKESGAMAIIFVGVWMVKRASSHAPSKRIFESAVSGGAGE